MLEKKFDLAKFKPPFKVWSEVGQKPVVQKHFYEAPIELCVDGMPSTEYLGSGWLDLHVDDVDDGNRINYLTPLFKDDADDPVILATCERQFQILEVELNQTITVDIGLEHALVPRRIAQAFLAGMRTPIDVAVIAAWVEEANSSNRPAVLVWHQWLSGWATH